MLDPRRLRPTAQGPAITGDGDHDRRLDWRLAVDIGGTFTDVVLLDADHRHRRGRQDAHHAVQPARRRAAPASPSCSPRAGVRPADITAPIVHATTLITNALIEGKTGRAALVTTAGFGDTLLIRDEHRYDMYDLQIEFPAPPIPRALTFELAERTGADGVVLRRPGRRRTWRRSPSRCGRPTSRPSASASSTRTSTPTTSASSPSTCGANSACRCASRPRSRRRSGSTHG